MLITDLKNYWEACREYHRRGSTTLLNTQYVLEKNEKIRALGEVLLDKANAEKNCESK